MVTSVLSTVLPAPLPPPQTVLTLPPLAMVTLALPLVLAPLLLLPPP